MAYEVLIFNITFKSLAKYQNTFTYLAVMWKESILKLLKLDSLVANLTGYVETRVELLKLEIREEIAKAIAKMTVLVLVMAAVSLFILFFSVSVALLIGEYLGFFEGFLIVSGFYLLITILVLLMRKSLSETMEKELMKKLKK